MYEVCIIITILLRRKIGEAECHENKCVKYKNKSKNVPSDLKITTKNKSRRSLLLDNSTHHSRINLRNIYMTIVGIVIVNRCLLLVAVDAKWADEKEVNEWQHILDVN